jgi:hypothetical protein
MGMPEHFIDLFFWRLPEEDKFVVFREAGIPDDRPEEVRGSGISSSTLAQYMNRHRHLIATALLRTRDLGDKEVARMVADGDLSLGQGFEGDVRVTISSPSLSGTEERRGGKRLGRVQLTDLAAASAMMSEMLVVIGAASKAFGREFDVFPPEVEVRGGSVEFAVGGSLFASGIGMVVACSAGLLAAPIVGSAAGLTLSTAGAIELALGWKQRIAETRKTEEETRAIRMETDRGFIRVAQNARLQQLEIQRKEIELEEARLRMESAETLEPKRRFAFSSLVPRAVVQAQAERWKFTEEYANHLLNRGLPVFSALKRYFDKVEIERESSQR